VTVAEFRALPVGTIVELHNGTMLQLCGIGICLGHCWTEDADGDGHYWVETELAKAIKDWAALAL
jgi:hypothetical protein